MAKTENTKASAMAPTCIAGEFPRGKAPATKKKRRSNAKQDPVVALGAIAAYCRLHSKYGHSKTKKS